MWGSTKFLVTPPNLSTAPGVFRWKYVRGLLSPFENATTPRDFSPCGVNHRVQNVFAMTHGMVRATARMATSPNEMEALLSGRLHALAKAHALVRRDFVSGLDTADLASLIREIVLPHNMDDAARRITIEGSPLRSSSRSSTRLALVLHELTTNAAKYGALSGPGGKVAITWRSQDDKLILNWREHGGPPVKAQPQTKGSGSALIHSTIVSQGAGEVEYDWRSHGLAVTISMPLSALD